MSEAARRAFSSKSRSGASNSRRRFRSVWSARPPSRARSLSSPPVPQESPPEQKRRRQRPGGGTQGGCRRKRTRALDSGRPEDVTASECTSSSAESRGEESGAAEPTRRFARARPPTPGGLRAAESSTDTGRPEHVSRPGTKDSWEQSQARTYSGKAGTVTPAGAAARGRRLRPAGEPQQVRPTPDVRST